MMELSPAPKIVLLALADIADDRGVCYPSIAHIARKACLSERAVQRRLAALKQLGLLSAQPRFRKDGSPTSNLYSLNISMSVNGVRGGAELTPPPVAASQDVPDQPPPGDGAGVARTANNTSSKPPQHRSVVVDDSVQLVFPQTWGRDLIASAVEVLGEIPIHRAQLIVDELASRSQVATISRPLSYLRALARSERAGAFVPELAHRAQTARKRRSSQIDATPSGTSDLSIAHDAIRVTRALLKQRRSTLPPSTNL